MYDRGMKPITHHLTERQITRLKALAERTGLTVAEIIRRAVDKHLEGQEKRQEREGKG